MKCGLVISLHLGHLRVFGSTCYALIPKEQRNKLGARSRKCIFPGYEEYSKAYRLYDEVNKKFFISRDVIFLKLIKMTSPLRDSLIIWKIILIQRTIMKMNMRFQTLKGGFLFWINLWNFHMKHQLPRMKKFLLLHLNKRFNWMM